MFVPLQRKKTGSVSEKMKFFTAGRTTDDADVTDDFVKDGYGESQPALSEVEWVRAVRCLRREPACAYPSGPALPECCETRISPMHTNLNANFQDRFVTIRGIRVSLRPHKCGTAYKPRSARVETSSLRVRDSERRGRRSPPTYPCYPCDPRHGEQAVVNSLSARKLLTPAPRNADRRAADRASGPL